LMSIEMGSDLSSSSSSSLSPCKAHQLPQSIPVAMRYSCEFHRYQKQLSTDDNDPFQPQSNKSEAIMPLVAILPERNSDSGAIERTELLAKKLLSVPSVQKRLDFLYELILSSS
jgi:hypothetical protein